ncbi:HEPN domain-containing protein [uncultured Sulfitobacter sp.]|uniref:HEPN domain-containing protein n=1 Tax=uncultured Sulfitobacter sp. TaxID=191468 RepID=UPI00261C77ED|nr:HEPN domain-containing protein [uncultured Sulfitobacter sp.]
MGINETELSERGKDAFFSLVVQRFFDKADEDYVTARFLFLNRLYSQFPWVACQALEKYLKAALLLRYEIAERKHNLKSNFSKLNQCSGVSFPRMIEAPSGFNFLLEQQNPCGKSKRWNYRMQTSQFISKLEKMGSPSSRYNQTNISIEHYDIHRFDAVSKMVRDTALDGPHVRLNRSIENLYSREEACQSLRFGRLKLTREVSEMIFKENYAYFPQSATSIDQIHFLYRDNNAVQNTFGAEDGDYISAEKLLDKLLRNSMN